jgi:hypothetical protein
MRNFLEDENHGHERYGKLRLRIWELLSEMLVLFNP